MKSTEIISKIASAIADKALNEGKLPWVKPWQETAVFGSFSNHVGKPYSWLNQMWLTAQNAPEGKFFTFKTALDNGTPVRKGSKSYSIAFSSPFVVEPTDEEKAKAADEGKEVKPKTIWLFKEYKIFHTSQLEGYKEPETAPVAVPTIEPIEDMESLINGYLTNGGPSLFFGGNRAYYAPSLDEVHIPQREQFSENAEYYSTILHELGHSTGAEKRLNRKIANKFGSEDYSREELVAELTACTILNLKGFNAQTSDRNSVAYLQGWVSFLKDKSKEFVTAVAQAEKAVALIVGE